MKRVFLLICLTIICFGYITGCDAFNGKRLDVGDVAESIVEDYEIIVEDYGMYNNRYLEYFATSPEYENIKAKLEKWDTTSINEMYIKLSEDKYKLVYYSTIVKTKIGKTKYTMTDYYYISKATYTYNDLFGE